MHFQAPPPPPGRRAKARYAHMLKTEKTERNHTASGIETTSHMSTPPYTASSGVPSMVPLVEINKTPTGTAKTAAQLGKTSSVSTLEVYKGPTDKQLAQEAQIRATQEAGSRIIKAKVALPRSCRGILDTHKREHSLMQLWPEGGSEKSMFLSGSFC